MVTSKTAHLFFSSKVKIKQIFKESWRRIKIIAQSFKRLVVFTIHKRAFSTFVEKCSENFNVMLEPFL